MGAVGGPLVGKVGNVGNVGPVADVPDAVVGKVAPGARVMYGKGVTL